MFIEKTPTFREAWDFHASTKCWIGCFWEGCDVLEAASPEERERFLAVMGNFEAHDFIHLNKAGEVVI